MAKTNPIGLRWDVDDLALLRKELKIESTQQLLSFLVSFWKANRLEGIKKTVSRDAKSATGHKMETVGPFNPDLLQKEFDEVFGAKSFKKTYQDYLRQAESTKDPTAFREEVKNDKSLGPNQRAAIYARIKQSTKP